ncbi:unnamed protein product [Bursaphelenchus xylophilus]|uniref:(pine wood nematode) hypothetical protein n=1 Tax=Bursaphelenchus xylophilus TaxID=6326 RepID=A0A7I8XKW6_BURXY|nr:unnamed protein product [Bursaphelenchus xylophilus]CAG9086130.1 unnamed protein product [Bursaphelenchus xylophilus]
MVAQVCLSERHLSESNRLFEDLFRTYQKLVRPVVKPNESVEIEFQFKLLQILDVHEKEQILSTSGILNHVWTDHRLRWSPEEYGNVSMLHVPGERLWLPDIILYNNADGTPTPRKITKADLYSNGSIRWTPPAIYNSLCLIDTQWFPYDEQLCTLKFGSWTYSGDELDLRQPDSDDLENITLPDGSCEIRVEVGVDITEYQESVEFDLLSVVGSRHERYYPCCDFPAIDITYDLAIRRKKLFYTVNLMIPCIGIAMLASFVFYLPSESHNKITLCISVLVALTVFFLLLIEIIPPTSTATPLIAKYLLFTMIMVSLSVAATTFVLNIHHQGIKPMPTFIRTFVIQFLGSSMLVYKKPSECFEKKKKRMPINDALRYLDDQFKKVEQVQCKIEKATLSYPTVISINHTLSNDKNEPVRRELRHKIRKISKNIKYIQKDIQRETNNEDMRSDWKLVAMLTDRVFLLIFSLVILAGTLVVTLTAPSLRDTRIPVTVYFPEVITYDDE